MAASIRLNGTQRRMAPSVSASLPVGWRFLNASPLLPSVHSTNVTRTGPLSVWSAATLYDCSTRRNVPVLSWLYSQSLSFSLRSDICSATDWLVVHWCSRSMYC